MGKVEKELLVSIIIPVYNVEKYIRGCVDSVLNQTYSNIQIILINDGSPDKCGDICDMYASQNENIIAIHKKNGGLSEARNFGLKAATGEFVLFLDSDDKLNKDSIESLIKKAQECQAEVIIPDRYFLVNETTSEKRLSFHFKGKGHFENPVKFALNIIIGQGRAWRASSLLYKRKLLTENKIAFPVGYIAEDIVFNLEVMGKAKTIAFLKKPTLLNLKRQGSITTSFQENLDQIFLFIDEKARKFLIETGNNTEAGQFKRKQLLARNAIVYISTLFSKKCTWADKKRIEKAEVFLKLTQVNQAFSISKIEPFFDSKKSVIYFKLMFHLIKRKKFKVAFFISKIASIINNNYT